jgi:hypothetical protein
MPYVTMASARSAIAEEYGLHPYNELVDMIMVKRANSNEHLTRKGHLRVQFSETDDRMICTHPSHKYPQDACACAFDAMWQASVVRTDNH